MYSYIDPSLAAEAKVGWCASSAFYGPVFCAVLAVKGVQTAMFVHLEIPGVVEENDRALIVVIGSGVDLFVLNRDMNHALDEAVPADWHLRILIAVQ